ncbi:BTB/POZ and MATH domain-containing protein 2 [Triticum aestivum]|uniref:BTB/POZ and MATH domain-containing protein 2 n=1 Tax=Triticum aestivum TaxID=4565 RepID=UPI001D001ADA|nr:BTB/POZ and MATH domain-containing protein 2-like [Triticum aestivum]
MAFAGISFVTAEGKLCTSTVSPIDSRAAHGYYPNGYDSKCAGFISVSLGLEDDDDENKHGDGEQPRSVKVQSTICFIDQFQWDQSVYIHEREIEDFGLNPVISDRDFMRRSTLERSSHLKDDSFIIRYDVIVLDVKADMSADGGAGTMASAVIQVPASDMPIHLKNLLRSKEGADVTFEVGGVRIAAHRCVLAARSTVFRAQLFGDIIQGSTTVKIDGIAAKVFRSMLDFIYTDTVPNMLDWDDMEEEAEEGNDVEEGAEEKGYISPKYIMWLLQLLEAADRYDLHRLKSICQEELSLGIQLSSVMGIIVLAERRGSLWLKEECLKFIKTHTSLHKEFTAEEVEEMTRTCSPSVLKKLIYKFAS